ncbi:MAG: DUF1801 domain-containing protein [Pseudomonadota bacterium]
MAQAATIPKPPVSVADAMNACPQSARACLDALRALIFETAAATPGVGEIEETLKWGQPSYLTHRPKSGTTIRLGWDEAGTRISLFVHCQTSLVDAWRDRYGDMLTLIGNREIALPTDQPLPRAALQHCIAMALTYHLRKTAP